VSLRGDAENKPRRTRQVEGASRNSRMRGGEVAAVVKQKSSDRETTATAQCDFRFDLLL